MKKLFILGLVLASLSCIDCQRECNCHRSWSNGSTDDFSMTLDQSCSSFSKTEYRYATSWEVFMGDTTYSKDTIIGITHCEDL